MIIDARGLGCPKPVILAEEALSKIGEGMVEVLVDNEASVKNLARFASKNGFYSGDSKEDNYWRVKIVKGYVCDINVSESGLSVRGTQTGVLSGFENSDKVETGKDLLLIIGSDVMGKDEALGRELMKGFFETMKVYKEVPHTIFFLNAGVKLTTIDKDIVRILAEIEKMGVEIFSCGTCLRHYNLESELKVGYRGTTTQIVEGIKDFKKTVWIG